MEHGTGTHTASDRALQPADLSGTLTAFDGSPTARALDRLTADNDLIEELMWREYSGPSWSRFARALAEYGLTVISSWCRSGKIFVECARKGCGLSPGEISGDDVLGLAGETVAVAIHKFRENVLIPRKWRPDKGASLKTFFIGQCVFRFPNIYRRWLREREGSYRGCRPPPEPRAAGDNPEVAVRLRRRLRAIDDDTLRRIVVMDGEGYNDREIAKATGLSRRAVEGRLSRFRAKGGRG